MPDHVSPVWLIGAGGMARDYGRVLAALEQPYEVIGRGDVSASAFKEALGRDVHRGGLDAFMAKTPAGTHAIVSVGVEELAATTLALLRHGVRNILVEKPAGVDRAEIEQLAAEATRSNANVHVGYNRRFYAATKRAREIIAEDGGVTSFNFEFTEWSHEIETLKQSARVKQNWLLANSSHVIDLAFFLGGKPAQLDAYVGGSLSWHPSASRFAGSGVSKSGALFSYSANWAAPGRWGVEVLTAKRRLIFRPMEKLQVMKIASVAINEEPIDATREQGLKPGLYAQTAAFLGGDHTDLCSIAELLENCDHYEQIGRGTRRA